MRNTRLLALAAALAMASVATAAVVTRNPLDYATGTDVSAAFPGVRLARIVNAPGIDFYGPIVQPAFIGRCTDYGVCPLLVSLGTIGGNVYNLQQYRNCYNSSRPVILPHPDCRRNFAVLQATFEKPPDFVEFELTWLSDPPGLVAYNAAGDEILTCLPGPPVAPAGCVTIRTLLPRREGFGTIRLTTQRTDIARVVVAGYIGTGRVTFMQYSRPVP